MYIVIFKSLLYNCNLLQLRSANDILAVEVARLKEQLDLQYYNEKKLQLICDGVHYSLEKLSSPLSVQDKEEVINTIKGMKKILYEGQIPIYCNNFMINSILSIYKRNMESNHIQVTYEIELPETLQIDVSELCVALSNALSFSTYTCIHIPEYNKGSVCLAICYKNRQLAIELVSSYGGIIQIDHNIPLFPSETDNGYIVKGIKAFSHKYNAMLNYELSTKYITLRMLIDDEMPSNHSC